MPESCQNIIYFPKSKAWIPMYAPRAIRFSLCSDFCAPYSRQHIWYEHATAHFPEIFHIGVLIDLYIHMPNKDILFMIPWTIFKKNLTHSDILKLSADMRPFSVIHIYPMRCMMSTLGSLDNSKYQLHSPSIHGKMMT